MTAAGGVGRDPGLQPERTALAWLRTGVVTALLAATTVGLALRTPSTTHLAVAACAALGVAAAALLVLTTARGVARGGLVATPGAWARLVVLAAACLLLAGAGALLALTP